MKIERFLLAVYIIYSAVMIRVIFEQDGNHLTGYYILTVLCICVVMHTAKFKTYEVRTVLTTILMQTVVMAYSWHKETFFEILPAIMLFVVLTGLYGMEKVIYINVACSIVAFFWHAFFLHTIDFRVPQIRVEMALQMFNLFFLQYIVYTWTKRNREGSEQLLKSIVELKKVQNSKDDFLANVSHEIRTPLNTICGMSEIVLKEQLPDNVRKQVQDIDTSGRNLMSVVRDILDFSELLSGKMELEEETYNVTSTINDIINMAQARRNGKKIEIIVNADADLPSVLVGDEKKLRRVVMNLVDNAIKFTEEGCVVIDVHHRKERYGINLIVSVKDTGIGISPENMEKISQSFTQADASRHRTETGLGLGLSISTALIHKMGGVITMKSRPGKGTTVQFVVRQEIREERPMVVIRNADQISIACYIDMEQFGMPEIRDEYANMIAGIASQMEVGYRICNNFVELKRRQEREKFSHVFTSIIEYVANRTYFDELALVTNVVVILDERDDRHVENPKILRLYKPFYVLSIASVLNGGGESRERSEGKRAGKFSADGAHVLVVDDNAMNLRVIEGLLNNYQIKVTMAESGQKALELVTKAEYDFIFMDHMMPGMDGVETMKRIRGMLGTYFKKVPIVALTANAVAGTREMFLEEGFTDFLEKPVERSVLERVLRRNISPDKICLNSEEAEDSSQKAKESQQKAEEASEAAELSQDENSLYNKLKSIGLDTQKGIYYCNGAERYENMLRIFCEECAATSEKVNRLFEENDIENYVIMVHGLKGNLGYLGAVQLAEQIKELEMAGKAGRIEVLKNNHGRILDSYQKFCREVQDCLGWKPAVEEAEEDSMELPELSDERFEQWTQELEDAAYELDEKTMLGLLEEIAKYRYGNTSLGKAMQPVQKKIKMSDIISAAELAKDIRNRLQRKEE